MTGSGRSGRHTPHGCSARWCRQPAAEQDRAALRWLELQAPPAVLAAGQHQGSQHASYVVTNSVVAGPGSQSHPARTNALRVRARSFPAAATVRFVWQDAQPSTELVHVLDAVARRVPYLGRSTGIALVSASASAADGQAGELEAGTASAQGPRELVDLRASSTMAGSAQDLWAVFEPCALEDSEVSLRVPYPGYLAELDTLYEAGRPAWEASRTRGYRLRKDAADQAPAPVMPSAYTDVVAFRFSGLRPDGRLVVRFTEALRSQVLSRVGEHAPAALHGHGADGRPHVAFLALPSVGWPMSPDAGSSHADGHLLGLAVAIPDLPAEERRAVLAGVLGLRGSGRSQETSSVVELPVPGIGTVELAYQPGLVRPWGASPERWRLGSRRWVTATPVVLDRFPKKKSQDVQEVLRSCRMVGLPEPVDIQVSGEPLMPGAVRLRPTDLPQQVRGRLYRHVSLTFDRAVSGPVLLGAGRYLGVGLLAPLADRSSR